MKRKIMYIIGALILIVGIIVIVNMMYGSTNLVDINKISNISIIDGKGNIMEVEDKEDINILAEYVNTIEYERASNVGYRGGFLYRISFVYDNSKEKNYTFGTQYVKIDGKYYTYKNEKEVDFEKLWDKLSVSSFAPIKSDV